MSTEAAEPEHPASPRVGRATSVYVGCVAVVGISLTAAAIRVNGLHVDDPTFWVVLLLAVLAWWFGSVEVDSGRVTLSFTSIVLLAAMALVGPAAAGIVGMLIGPMTEARSPLTVRIFNSGMLATMGVVGGAAYLMAGGKPGEDPVGPWQIVREIGIPVLVADVVQLVVNLVLLAVVVRLAAGMPMRAQVGRLLGTSGPAHLGYGIIAFIMVVLWEPAGLGSASVFLILPPLVVAQWAYRQYAEEVKGHERALHVLVAAVEAKAPHLMGHSTRVADLSASMAEQLGLRSQAVADARVAGMLHDLGLTTLPTGLVRSTGVGNSSMLTYPSRGVQLLQGLSFLSGSLDAIAHHREAVVPGSRADLSVAALVVGLADEFDLLTEVGTAEGVVLSTQEAVDQLRSTPSGREDLLRALDQALSRRAGVSA